MLNNFIYFKFKKKNNGINRYNHYNKRSFNGFMRTNTVSTMFSNTNNRSGMRLSTFFVANNNIRINTNRNISSHSISYNNNCGELCMN